MQRLSLLVRYRPRRRHLLRMMIVCNLIGCLIPTTPGTPPPAEIWAAGQDHMAAYRPYSEQGGAPRIIGAREAGAERSDRELRAVVRQYIDACGQPGDRRVSVEVADALVTLRGLVDSVEERQCVIKAAWAYGIRLVDASKLSVTPTPPNAPLSRRPAMPGSNEPPMIDGRAFRQGPASARIQLPARRSSGLGAVSAD